MACAIAQRPASVTTLLQNTVDHCMRYSAAVARAAHTRWGFPALVYKNRRSQFCKERAAEDMATCDLHPKTDTTAGRQKSNLLDCSASAISKCVKCPSESLSNSSNRCKRGSLYTCDGTCRRRSQTCIFHPAIKSGYRHDMLWGTHRPMRAVSA